jgi:Ca-activated chloride channel homolog
MKKIGIYSTLSLMILCIAFVAFACRNVTQDYAPQDKVPIHTVGNDTMIPVDVTSLALTTGLDNSQFIFDPNGAIGYYYVEAKSVAAAPAQRKRSPLNLSLVIDRSGSMSGGKLAYAKQAAKHVIDRLSEEDYVSVVTYDEVVQIVCTANKVGDKTLLKNRIEAIQTGGNTNLGGGMDEGYRQVKSSFKSGYVNRVLLLSDGQANVGMTDIASLTRIAHEQNILHGISISTFGLGLDFNENLMTPVAEQGGGNYYFIDNPENITGIFQKELQGLQNVVAQKAVINVVLPQGVSLLQVYGQSYRQVGNNVSLQLSEMIAGQTKSALLKFSISGQAPSMKFQTSLDYLDALTPTLMARRQEASSLLSQTASQEAYKGSENAFVKAQVVLYQSNENLEKAMQAVDEGHYDQAKTIVGMNDAYLKSNLNYVQAHPELQVQMSNNNDYQTQIYKVEKLRPEDVKLLQKSSKSMNYDVRARH